MVCLKGFVDMRHVHFPCPVNNSYSLPTENMHHGLRWLSCFCFSGFLKERV